MLVATSDDTETGFGPPSSYYTAEQSSQKNDGMRKLSPDAAASPVQEARTGP